MGKISFIHLSDIHFVKTSGNPADIDQDLRDAIITDIKTNAKISLGNVDGVLVSGDIAFSGNREEYEKAQKFLSEITDIFGINKSEIYCVPGNHDVDQNVPTMSSQVYDTQYRLDNASSIDEIDKIFEAKINDLYYNDILFKPIEEYNDFASKFECNIGSDVLNWSFKFQLDCNMKLNVYGMNSCFISNSDDHKIPGVRRLMYIGQAQIPKREDDTVCMILCHHPPDCWKFTEVIQKKIDRRADIQLYGHKHTQTITLTKDNVIITSGATHPVRNGDWNPRYNWITIECLLVGEKRIIKVVIYPRILDKCRDRFIPDEEVCKGKMFIEHILPIDEKRENDLYDKCCNEIKNENIDYYNKQNGAHECKVSINQRELVYKFFNLSYIRQTEILASLNLLDEDDKGKRYSSIITKIINKAKLNNQINELWNKINDCV